MTNVPESLSDVIKSDSQREIFSVITKQIGTFVIGDIVQDLAQNNIVVKSKEIQMLLMVLQHRKFIVGSEIRDPAKRGRIGKKYQIVKR